jgi:hypothetical protein
MLLAASSCARAPLCVYVQALSLISGDAVAHRPARCSFARLFHRARGRSAPSRTATRARPALACDSRVSLHCVAIAGGLRRAELARSSYPAPGKADLLEQLACGCRKLNSVSQSELVAQWVPLECDELGFRHPHAPAQRRDRRFDDRLQHRLPSPA